MSVMIICYTWLIKLIRELNDGTAILLGYQKQLWYSEEGTTYLQDCQCGSKTPQGSPQH